MKKMFILGMVSLFTVSTYAQDINTFVSEDYLVGVRGPGAYAEEFLELIPEGKKVGSCNILESKYTFVGGMEDYVSTYKLYLRNGNKKFGIALDHASRVDVYRINDVIGATNIYDANVEEINFGKKTNLKMRVISTPSTVEIMVETTKENETGEMKVVKNRTFSCISK